METRLSKGYHGRPLTHTHTHTGKQDKRGFRIRSWNSVQHSPSDTWKPRSSCRLHVPGPCGPLHEVEARRRNFSSVHRLCGGSSNGKARGGSDEEQCWGDICHPKGSLEGEECRKGTGGGSAGDVHYAQEAQLGIPGSCWGREAGDWSKASLRAKGREVAGKVKMPPREKYMLRALISQGISEGYCK